MEDNNNINLDFPSHLMFIEFFIKHDKLADLYWYQKFYEDMQISNTVIVPDFLNIKAYIGNILCKDIVIESWILIGNNILILQCIYIYITTSILSVIHINF